MYGDDGFSCFGAFVTNKRDNETYWREVRRRQFSPAYFAVSEAMIGAFHAKGGFEAAQTGMVNVEGAMTDAVLDTLKTNGWLNEAGLSALSKANQ